MSAEATAAPRPAPGPIWHDAECGGYGADLGAWERLATASGGPVLDLGAGTGRVALHLAARGHRVLAVDDDAELLAVLAERATDRGIEVEPIRADVRELDLGRPFPLIIAPMQLVHLLGGAAGRARAWAALARHLASDGVLAIAILREPLPPSGRTDPLPDVRDVAGWVHSSTPLEVRVTEGSVELERLRQVVDPEGRLTEEPHVTHLDRLPLGLLEGELSTAGLRIIGAEPIAETDEHVGSLLVRVGADRG